VFSFVHWTDFLSMALAGLACVALVEIAGAGSFQVNPIRITLTPQGSSSLLTVRNEGNERLRLQVDFYAWDQSKQGEMILNPTDDLVVYPALLTIDTGNERNVRVGTKSPVVSKEKSYRIFIEELPPATKRVDSGIRILTRIGVPIFIQPQPPKSHALIENVAVHKSEILFEVLNRGNVHFLPRGIRVKGTNSTGINALEQKLDPWYILAGGSRQYRLEISPSDCLKLKDLIVEVDLEEKSLRQQLPLQANSCGR
jgi:fimbrial chaperone protein